MLRSRRNIGKRSRTGLKYKAHMDGLPNLRIYKRPVKVDSGFFNAIQFRIARGVQRRRNLANPALRSRRIIGKRSRTGLKYKAHMDGLHNLRIYKRPVKVDSGFYNAIQFRIARGVQWRRNFANPPYGQGEE